MPAEQLRTDRCFIGGIPLEQGLQCPQTHAQFSDVLTYNMQTGCFLLRLFFQDYVPMKQTLPHCVI